MAERTCAAGRVARAGVLAALTTLFAAPAQAQQSTTTAAVPVTYAAQGWSAADRETFYTTGQGSHLIPFAWFRALQQNASDQPFMADQLARYGYLRGDGPNDLPVGFVVEAKTGQLGMTCAACHTNQLEYQKDGKT